MYKDFKFYLIVISIALLSVSVAGCSDSGPTWTTVKDDTVIIEDGQYITMHLDSGTYNIDISSDVELDVNIVGTDYGEEETESYSLSEIKLETSRSLRIENPSMFGTGESASATITIEKKILSWITIFKHN